MARRPAIRKSDLRAAFAFATEQGLKVSALKCTTDGAFVFDFTGQNQTESNESIDRELAMLEARHGKG